MLRARLVFIGCAVVGFAIGFAVTHDAGSSTSQTGPTDTVSQDAEVVRLKAEIIKLQSLVPDQAAIMSHVAYHFSNLWFAIDQENWLLADFYLGEVRANVKWASRSKPLRKDAAGKDVDIVSIAQAVDNSPFTDMKKAIDKHDKRTCVTVYDQTLVACYSCHKASSKPYLRPQRPAAPEARMVNFDPNATTPK